MIMIMIQIILSTVYTVLYPVATANFSSYTPIHYVFICRNLSKTGETKRSRDVVVPNSISVRVVEFRHVQK